MGILSWLWSEPAPEQVQVLEQQAPSFEQRLERIVQLSRGLKGRTSEERESLIEDITEALAIIEGAINVLEASQLATRAKEARRRLRTIRTNAQKVA